MRARLLLVALYLLAACSGDDGNGPPPPPDFPGELAYIDDEEIFIRHFTDGSTRRIERNVDNEGLVIAISGLAWQPDGRALVYASYNAKQQWYELHRVPLDGSPETVLYPEAQHQALPAFAPDGRLAYWVSGFEHGSTIFMNGLPSSLGDGCCTWSRPAWSTDGSAMLIVRRVEGVDRLSRVDLASGATVEVFQAATDSSHEQLLNPAYSRSGDRVAFTRGVVPPDSSCTEEIWVTNADGSNPSRLTSGHYDDEATWSPDDAWIAFARQDPSGKPIIAVVSSAGGSVTQLSQGAVFAPAWR